MFSRFEFLHGLAVATLSAATPSAATPNPSPSPSASPHHDFKCVENPSLAYDRPLELTMPVLDGPDFRLSAYRGRAVILNIFATWCGPCNDEMPYLVEAHNKYADRGLSIIGIDDREADDDVRAFRRKYKIPYPIAMDRRGGFTQTIEVGNREGDTSIPASLFIMPDGRLYCYLVQNMNGDDLTYLIERFLAAAPPTQLTDAGLSAQASTKPPIP